MTGDSQEELDRAIVELYRGPLEDFIAGRDGLVKRLRSEGRRDDANAVKGLRKPSRTAWALNAGVHDDPAIIERCAAAVVAVIEAQSGSGDVRGAFEELRTAARNFAAGASQAAAAAGHAVDQAGLVPAMSAVIGDAAALEELRVGRLTAVPQGGGLERLTGSPHVATRRPSAKRTPEPAPGGSGAMTTAGETLRQAEAAVAPARRRSKAAQQALRKAERRAEVAQKQLREAERKAQAVGAELDGARHEAADAESHEREVNDAVDQARAELERHGRKSSP